MKTLTMFSTHSPINYMVFVLLIFSYVRMGWDNETAASIVHRARTYSRGRASWKVSLHLLFIRRMR